MADAATVKKKADEVARLAAFGHGVSCRTTPHSSKRPDELDTKCNLCAAIYAYHVACGTEVVEIK